MPVTALRPPRLRAVGVGLIAGLLLALLLGLADGHVMDPRVRSFIVSQSETSQFTTKATALSGEDYTCSFKYQVTGTDGKPPAPPKPPTPPPAPAVAPPAASAGGRLTDLSLMALVSRWPCVRRTEGYWTYEVCFDKGKVIQFNGPDVYTLATQYSDPQGGLRGSTALTGINGQACEARKDFKRQVKLNLHCSRSPQAKTTPVLYSIQETATCVYAFEIATDAVCGDARFPVVHDSALHAAAAPAPSAPPPRPDPLSTGDMASEDWVLELVQLDNGALMCSVFSTEHRAASSKLVFTSFALEINKAVAGSDGTVAPHDAGSACQFPMPGSHILRRHGRVPLQEEEYDVARQGSLRNTDKFGGALAYAKVIVDPCAMG